MGCWCSIPCLRVEGWLAFHPGKERPDFCVFRTNPRRTSDLDSSAGTASGGGCRHFDQLARVDVVDVAVDGDGLRHERAGANAGHVCDDGLVLVFDGEPFDELCGSGTGAFAYVLEALGGEGGGFEAVGEEAAHHIVGEEEHAAVGMVDDEEFFCTE